MAIDGLQPIIIPDEIKNYISKVSNSGNGSSHIVANSSEILDAESGKTLDKSKIIIVDALRMDQQNGLISVSDKDFHKLFKYIFTNLCYINMIGSKALLLPSKQGTNLYIFADSQGRAIYITNDKTLEQYIEIPPLNTGDEEVVPTPADDLIS